MGHELKAYEAFLRRWMPGAELRKPRGVGRFIDGVVTWRGPAGRIRYVLEGKSNLATLDARFVADQFKRRIRELADDDLRHARPLLMAPYVRAQQAAALEQANVDFVDQVGNARLQAPGLHVHVEGRKPPKEPARRRVSATKGWVKTTMALLIRPELLHEPYRAMAQQAGVALGTVGPCLRDLRARGLLRGQGEQRELVDRQELVPLWVQVYIDRLRPTLEERWLQVQVADKAELWSRLDKVLAKYQVGWTLTGADAAERMTNYFHAETTEIYATLDAFDNRALLHDLRAQPAARGGNVLVVEPPAPLVISTATAMSRKTPIAPPLLVYAELRYRGTDQALEAAELLLPRLTGDVEA